MLLPLLLVFAFGLLAPVAALASGPSAGDQQYVDPLGGGSGNSGSGGGGGGGQSSGSSGSSSSSSGASTSGTVGSSSSSSATLSASSGTTATTSTGTSSGTLPYTGLDVPIAIAVGVGLIASGFFLRRRILRA